MVEVIVASHGQYAQAGIQAAGMVLGEIPSHVHVLSVTEEGGIEAFNRQATSLADSLQGREVLLLADMFGGSPFNALLARFSGCNYRVITGFNLPMLVEAVLRAADYGLEALCDTVVETGAEGVKRLDKSCLEEE